MIPPHTKTHPLKENPQRKLRVFFLPKEKKVAGSPHSCPPKGANLFIFLHFWYTIFIPEEGPDLWISLRRRPSAVR